VKAKHEEARISVGSANIPNNDTAEQQPPAGSCALDFPRLDRTVENAIGGSFTAGEVFRTFLCKMCIKL
jgi:hypothetical protein